MAQNDHHSCNLEKTILEIKDAISEARDQILVAILAPLMILGLYIIIIVLQTRPPQHSEKHNHSHKRGSLKVKRIRSRLPRKKGKHQGKSQLFISATNFLYQCGECHMTEKKCCCSGSKAVTRDETVLVDTKICGRGRNSSKKSTGQFCELIHTVYTKVPSIPQQADSVIHVLVHSSHASEIKKATQFFAKACVRIHLRVIQILRSPCRFFISIAGKDGMCDPKEIECSITQNEEKVFHNYKFSIQRFRASDNVISDAPYLEYKWAGKHVDSKSFPITTIHATHGSENNQSCSQGVTSDQATSVIASNETKCTIPHSTSAAARTFSAASTSSTHKATSTNAF